MVGMRPLEKSLEKLDDVRKKKLSEMIGSSTGDPSTLPSSGLESNACYLLCDSLNIVDVIYLNMLTYLFITIMSAAVQSSGGSMTCTEVSRFLI